MITAQTQRLLLRPFVPEDAAAFAEYRSHPDVARYQSWDAPYPIEAARQLIAEMMSHGDAPRPGEWNQIAVALRSTGELIGDCAFRVMATEPGTAQLGFTLSRPVWGMGYATEAAREMMRWLFDVQRMERVVADCDERNSASQRVLERLGMRRTAGRKILFKGEVVEELTYELRGHADFTYGP